MLSRRGMLAVSLAAAALPARAEEPRVFTVSGLALRGHDPVAYFTEGRPVEGRTDIQLRWMGATWRFASEENREVFERMPQKYAPQYGGYCAYAAAQGQVAPADPLAFTVHEGRLYLNHSRQVRALWEKDRTGLIAAADANWPHVLKK